MKILSINVGSPREIQWRGKAVRTSIFKASVQGAIQVNRLNLAGDQQSDLSVHGGADKAVYAYPAEHYAFWRQEMPGIDFPWGAFGENFTTEGLLESAVRIGDRFWAGSSEFVVTQPRMPCFKLGIRFGRPDIVKRFLNSGRTGFYLAVLREGEVAAGDVLVLTGRDEHALSVTDIVELYATKAASPELMRRAAESPALAASWRDYFRKRISESADCASAPRQP